MKIAPLIGIALALSLTLAIESWVSGYFIRMAPFGLFTPLVTLGLLLALLMLVVSLIVTVIHARRPARQKATLVLIILAIALLPFFTPFRLSGFEYRIRQKSDASWLRLASDAQRMLRAETPNQQLPDFHDGDWNRRYVLKLAENHPVLNLGDFPPKLFVKEDSVDVYWGSGLIGTLVVHISADPKGVGPSPPSDREKRISDVVTIAWD